MSAALFLVGASWTNEGLLRSWVARQPAAVQVLFAVLPRPKDFEERIAELEQVICGQRADARPWAGEPVDGAVFSLARHGRHLEVVEEESKLFARGVRVTRIPDGAR